MGHNPGKELRKGGCCAARHAVREGERLLMVYADTAGRFKDLEPLWAALDRLGEKSPSNAAIAVGSRAHLVKTEAVVKVISPPPSININLMVKQYYSVPFSETC